LANGARDRRLGVDGVSGVLSRRLDQ
jgi:hypothetical protein